LPGASVGGTSVAGGSSEGSVGAVGGVADGVVAGAASVVVGAVASPGEVAPGDGAGSAGGELGTRSFMKSVPGLSGSTFRSVSGEPGGLVPVPRLRGAGF
jgi:hypothetical protein